MKKIDPGLSLDQNHLGGFNYSRKYDIIIKLNLLNLGFGLGLAGWPGYRQVDRRSCTAHFSFCQTISIKATKYLFPPGHFGILRFHFAQSGSAHLDAWFEFLFLSTTAVSCGFA